MTHRLNPALYTIAWIAILPTEAEAALAVLDKRHDGYFETRRGDDYLYIGGEISGHRVVVATLPAGQHYGIGAAASLASQMKTRFHNLWFALLVGVAAGLPNLVPQESVRQRDIRLGDVLVCIPDQGCPGIVQYDLGRDTHNGFLPIGRQTEIPAIWRSAISQFQLKSKRPFLRGNELAQMLASLHSSDGYHVFARPSQDTDKLYHTSEDTLSPVKLVIRDPRDAEEPVRVWYGRLGSGNSLMRNSIRRDELRDKHDLIGLEMEAAGVMSSLPTGVVRGVCDYGDEHKTKEWQPHAAAVAAIYAKGVLSCVHVQNEVSTSSMLQGKLELAIGQQEQNRTPSFLHLDGAPVMSSELFIGRDAALVEMDAFLRPDGTSQEQRCLVLAGIGGIGKTQLAIAYARSYRHSYHCIFWLNAASLMTLNISLQSTVDYLFQNDKINVSTESQNKESFRHFLSNVRSAQWLLIFDNYDDPEAFDLHDYLPPVDHGSIVVTSRLPDHIRGRRMDVRPLYYLSDSLRVLETRSRRQDLEKDSSACQLAERLNGFPLALATAGAYLSKCTLSFEQYLVEYERRWNFDRRRPARLPEYRDLTLYTTWDLSYNRLLENDPEAADLLRLFAYFGDSGIWFDLLRVENLQSLPQWLHDLLDDHLAFHSVMGTLIDYCFVEIQSKNQLSYGMHACVRDWTLACLNKIPDADLYWFAVECISTPVIREKNTNGDLENHYLISHAVRLAHEHFAEAIESQEKRDYRLNQIWHLAGFLSKQSHLTKAAVLYQRLLVVMIRLNILNDDALFIVQLCLPSTRAHLCRDVRQSSPMKIPNLSTYIDSTIATILELGDIFRGQGQRERAEQILLLLIEYLKRYEAFRIHQLLQAVFILHHTYMGQRKFEQAENLHPQLLALCEQGRATEFDSRVSFNMERQGRAYRNIARVCQSQGKPDEAERIFRQSLDNDLAIFGQQSHLTLNSTTALAYYYAEQNRFEDAEDVVSQSLATYTAQFQCQAVPKYAEDSYAWLIRLGVRSARHNELASKSRLADLVQLIRDRQGSDVTVLRSLARALVFVDDEHNAQKAYGFAVRYVDGRPMDFSGKYCDNCLSLITIHTGLHVCKNCIEVDLCDRCMEYYYQGTISIPGCLKHIFFHFDSDIFKDDSPSMDANISAMKVWIHELADVCKETVRNLSRKAETLEVEAN